MTHQSTSPAPSPVRTRKHSDARTSNLPFLAAASISRTGLTEPTIRAGSGQRAHVCYEATTDRGKRTARSIEGVLGMAVDYVKAPLVFKVRKVLRYGRLYGVARTLVKVRSQYHVRQHAPAL